MLVRTEATNLCYTLVPAVLGLAAAAAAGAAGAAVPRAVSRRRRARRRINDMAVIQGHGGVGIVEAVGPEVRRVQVGDRVCVSGTPHCGACYRCLRGRSDMCQFLSAIGADDLVAIGDLADGTPVYQNSHIGGLAEVMVAFEEWVVPIFTTKPAAEVGMVCGCTSVAGLGATAAHGLVGDRARLERRRRRLRPDRPLRRAGRADRGRDDDHRDRSDSCAARGRARGRRDARARPERRRRRPRRQGALADDVADRSALGRRTQSRRPPPRRGRRLRRRSRGPRRRAAARRARPGPDRHPADAAGVSHDGARRPLRSRRAPFAATSSLPGNLFSFGGVTHHSGQAGGCSPMRDIPRFVELLEKGQFDARTLATAVVPLERLLEGYEEVAYRTTITGIMTVS